MITDVTQKQNFLDVTFATLKTCSNLEQVATENILIALILYLLPKISISFFAIYSVMV